MPIPAPHRFTHNAHRFWCAFTLYLHHVRGAAIMAVEVVHMTAEYTADIGAQLRAPFPPEKIKSAQKDSTGFRYSYIQSRDVFDRLDEVVGPGNWSTEFRVIDPERWAVECRLTVLGVTKADVGYPNARANAKQEDEPLKSAYSDAVKRAAVQHGVGRFLYDMDTPSGGGGGGRGAQNRWGGGRPTSAPGRGWQPDDDDDRIFADMDDRPAPGQGALTLATPKQGPTQRAAGESQARVLPATEPQIKAIFAIARGAQAMDEAETEARCRELYGVTPSGLSRRQASEFIDVLKSGGGA